MRDDMIEPQNRINVAAKRQTRKWSRKTQLGRVLWAVALPLFRWSPRPLWGWRRLLLRLFGARVGRDVQVYPTSRITFPWNLHLENGRAIDDYAILYTFGPRRLNGWDRHFSVDWDGGHIKFFSKWTLGEMVVHSGFSELSFQGVGRVPFVLKSMVLTARK
jgi:hypothetical protein